VSEQWNLKFKIFGTPEADFLKKMIVDNYQSKWGRDLEFKIVD